MEVSLILLHFLGIFHMKWDACYYTFLTASLNCILLNEKQYCSVGDLPTFSNTLKKCGAQKIWAESHSPRKPYSPLTCCFIKPNFVEIGIELWSRQTYETRFIQTYETHFIQKLHFYLLCSKIVDTESKIDLFQRKRTIIMNSKNF